MELHIVVRLEYFKAKSSSLSLPPPHFSLSCHIVIKLEHLICFINGMWVEMMVCQPQVNAFRDSKSFSLVFTRLPSQKNAPCKYQERDRHREQPWPQPTAWSQAQWSTAKVNQILANLQTHEGEIPMIIHNICIKPL